MKASAQVDIADMVIHGVDEWRKGGSFRHGVTQGRIHSMVDIIQPGHGAADDARSPTDAPEAIDVWLQLPVG